MSDNNTNRVSITISAHYDLQGDSMELEHSDFEGAPDILAIVDRDKDERTGRTSIALNSLDDITNIINDFKSIINAVNNYKNSKQT